MDYPFDVEDSNHYALVCTPTLPRFPRPLMMLEVFTAKTVVNPPGHVSLPMINREAKSGSSLVCWNSSSRTSTWCCFWSSVKSLGTNLAATQRIPGIDTTASTDPNHTPTILLILLLVTKQFSTLIVALRPHLFNFLHQFKGGVRLSIVRWCSAALETCMPFSTFQMSHGIVTVKSTRAVSEFLWPSFQAWHRTWCLLVVRVSGPSRLCLRKKNLC